MSFAATTISAQDTALSAAAQSRRFAPGKTLRIVLASALLLIPCFWHRNIEAGDLANHTYNAWLAGLITQGRAPGLYLAPQYNNVLFDVALATLGRATGLLVAEKILVCASVLLFFWGCFGFIGAIAGESPWFLTPWLAMLAYGWTFEMGFMNYYISIGLAFVGLYLVASERRWAYVLAWILAAPILWAHPIGLLWFVGSGIYLYAARVLPQPARQWLFPVALLAVLCTHFYVAAHFRTHDPTGWRFLRFSGADQLVLYRQRYRLFVVLAPLIGIAAFLIALRDEATNRQFWMRLRTPGELFALMLLAAAMLWEGITVPAYAMGITFLPERITSITAVLGLCLVCCLRPGKWFFTASAIMSALFFFWLYQDSATLNRMEEQARTLISEQPAATRVIETTLSLPGSRIAALHIVPRACIARCFDYSNYEPSSRQFRVRTQQKNALAVWNASDGLAMREGRYVVRSDDLPLTQIYQCDLQDPARLCSRKLSAEESTSPAVTSSRSQ